jgi:hypothetical protein
MTKLFAAAIAALCLSSAAQAQCYDNLGRPRICPNTPSGLQRGVVNIQRNYSSARVEESWRPRQILDAPFLEPRIRIQFEGFEPPEELFIGGRVWRRIR